MFSIFNGNLCHASNSMEDITMIHNIMMMNIFQDTPLLKSFVDVFMAAPNFFPLL